ncbi:quinol dehydrogenase membrane component [Salmonella enterica subsp. enterica serovar Heidelberg str. N189]|nr:quinol dehydrogenase membrane component [Salmonella enterica subsp. enterica serovar Heidelberg str. N189]
MANRKRDAGREARAKKGWWRSHRWLVLRRISQFMVLGMFLSGPWLGFWVCMATTAVVCCSIPSR